MEKINLIFDCDGTLVDSYQAIVDRICRLFQRHNVLCQFDAVKENALKTTTDGAIEFFAKQNGLDFVLLKNEFSEVDENKDIITMYPHVKDVLDNPKYRCFVFTHRGISTEDVFRRLDIWDSLTEVVNSSYHFKRKPDPEAINYLVDKYGLDKDKTYYIGDRAIDIECGLNAGVHTIFYKSNDLDIDCSKADYVIDDLIDINSLFLEK